MKPVTLAIVGGGGRGTGYASYAKDRPEDVRIVGVAEPRDFYRNRLAQTHQIPAENVFTDWKDLAARERFADAVVISTQDAMHVEPAVALAGNGYHILLEKPMAPNEQDCRRIVDAVEKSGVIFAVCHVMRYTRYTRKLKEMITSGLIGDVVSLQHLEPVGYWHQAHSFVRGNWRNEAESSPMLLAKSCHDLDWIHYIMGVPCLAVSSFGSLKHFRAEEKPEGAGDRCMDCNIEGQCPYSAVKIYHGRLQKGHTGWPVNVVTPEPTEESLRTALRDGPYGRCVYACDNNVVDNQVVGMSFEGGRTASFTMTAFTESAGRRTTVFGTRGELRGDGSKITHFDFLTDETQVIDTEASDGSILGGHGGGDEGVMSRFVAAVAAEDDSKILSGTRETLESHLMVFAAEQARRENRVVAIEV